MAEVLQEVASKWAVTNKLAACVSDNARNIVLALHHAGWVRIPCIAHTLQLAVKAGLQLPAVVRVTARCRKIVMHFHHSHLAQTALETKQGQLGLPPHKLIQDVSTRWNSTYYMLNRLLEQRQAVTAVLLESTKTSVRELMLSASETSEIEFIASSLEPLAHATTMLCSETVPSLSLVQPLLAALLKRHLKHSEVDAKIVADIKSAIARSIAERFSDADQKNIMLKASALDPRFKAMKLLSSSERADVYAQLLIAASELFAATLAAPEDEPVPSCPSPKRSKMDDFLECGNASDSSGGGSSPNSGESTAIEKEVDAYRAEEQIDRALDPLEWWKLNEHRFKVLSKLAGKLLCIPATSIPSERLFSSAGTIVNKKRASLSPNNVDMLTFLCKNL